MMGWFQGRGLWSVDKGWDVVETAGAAVGAKAGAVLQAGIWTMMVDARRMIDAGEVEGKGFYYVGCELLLTEHRMDSIQIYK